MAGVLMSDSLSADRRIAVKPPANLLQPTVGGVSRSRFESMFPDSKACETHVKRIKLDTQPCIQCGEAAPWLEAWDACVYRHACGKIRSCKTGTLLEGSQIDLWLSFYAMLMFSNYAMGLPVGFACRHFGLGHVAATRLLDRIRMHIALIEPVRQLGGPGEIVYVDEMTMGVRRRDGTRDTAIVFGLRDATTLQLFIAERRSSFWARQFIAAIVAPGSHVVTDAFQGYKWLANSPWGHSIVNHKKEWKNREGFCHASIDSVFGQIRRVVQGTYYSVGSEHLWKYLMEVQFRFNRRWDPDLRFLDMIADFPALSVDNLLAARAAIDHRQAWRADPPALAAGLQKRPPRSRATSDQASG